ncbi:hypothetical protein SDC9_164406 [bioreactor metagenome]|uniref:Uncharacterized protein n=1 Tax=bioreactor metagenome TaxID=1076179 RepID=A0A645FRK4_9ZZZZ
MCARAKSSWSTTRGSRRIRPSARRIPRCASLNTSILRGRIRTSTVSPSIRRGSARGNSSRFRPRRKRTWSVPCRIPPCPPRWVTRGRRTFRLSSRSPKTAIWDARLSSLRRIGGRWTSPSSSAHSSEMCAESACCWWMIPSCAARRASISSICSRPLARKRCICASVRRRSCIRAALASIHRPMNSSSARIIPSRRFESLSARIR